MQIVFSISFGYFIFDFFWCMMRHTEGFYFCLTFGNIINIFLGILMLFHHLYTIAGLSVAIFTRRYGFELICTIIGSEITNPILQLRWFLKYFKHTCHNRKPCICSLVDFAFFFTFFLFRLVLGSVLLYCYVTCDHTDVVGRIGGTVIYLIGWVFWIQIVKYAWRNYFFSSEKKEIEK